METAPVEHHKGIRISTEGNLTICQGVPDIGAALTLSHNITLKYAEKRGGPLNSLKIIDFDGPLAVSLAEQICVGFTLSAMNSLRQHLAAHPNESVITLTSRHREYGWGRKEQWLFELTNCLSAGTHYQPSDIPFHSLAYDHPQQLVNILQSNTPIRAIMTGAAKDAATRALETALGHRKLITFLTQDIFHRHKDEHGRLLHTFEAIFKSQGGPNSVITIIDDGAMWEATKLIAASTEAHVIYISIENFKIGNIPKLVWGAMGILAYALRNASERGTLTRTIDDP